MLAVSTNAVKQHQVEPDVIKVEEKQHVESDVISVEKQQQVKSDVSSVGWKEIVLTRDDFEQLKRPVVDEVVVEKDDNKFVFVFLFPILYFVMMFKDEFKIPEYLQGVLKFVFFTVAVYYIMYDNTLTKMRVNITSRMLIGFCFGGLLVASSSFV